MFHRKPPASQPPPAASALKRLDMQESLLGSFLAQCRRETHPSPQGPATDSADSAETTRHAHLLGTRDRAEYRIRQWIYQQERARKKGPRQP